ncbi:MAG: hypothetical protein SOW25_07890 [Helicobacter sp.]|nr:hypothetical protein [Helicobacteraceae bacterium]MDY3114225.1 hypothetical protein [Helicobacter sp.]
MTKIIHCVIARIRKDSWQYKVYSLLSIDCHDLILSSLAMTLKALFCDSTFYALQDFIKARILK